MNVVLTYGTFDLFHVGHVRLLKRLKDMGQYVIVGVSTDEFNNLKGKKAFSSYEERVEIIKACRYVDEVIPEYSWDQKELDIKSYNVDIFAIGDDWIGKFDDLKSLCEVIYLSRTDKISTSFIKNELASTDNI